MGDHTTVSKFLRNFKEKIKYFDILFLDDRGKNTRTLALLEITPARRKQVLEELEVKDYSQGPLDEAMYGGGAVMWVFGKNIRAQEIYIKITMGVAGGAAICISFHLAEFPMKYPLK